MLKGESNEHNNRRRASNCKRTFTQKPLDPHLFAGAKGTVDDVRVQTGYPVWNLIAQWMAGGYRDEEVFAMYSDMPHEEWEAARQYYIAHKSIIDARIITNTQPAADDDVPPMKTPDEYFAWLHRDSDGDSQTRNGVDTHG